MAVGGIGQVKTMRVEFFKSLWGFEAMEPAQFIDKAQKAGYHGFESPMVLSKADIQSSQLLYIAQGFCETVESVQSSIDQATELGAILLNLHVGKDYWSEDHTYRFLEGSCRAVEQCPIPVTFETHRGRLFYSAQSTSRILSQFPQIRLTADFSHWTCVSESMLQDQAAELEEAMQRTIYIHARVGHEEGPQVSDPREEAWASHVERFETWWSRIAEIQRNAGAEVLRIDPEYGPPNYMTIDPRTNEPIADLWDVCLAMRDRLESFFAG